jgi:hypothetical protein
LPSGNCADPQTYSGVGGQGPLSLPADPSVMTRDLTQQVFAVLHYHFTV